MLAEKIKEAAAKRMVEIGIAAAGLAAFALADLLLPETALEAIGRAATGRIVLGLVLLSATLVVFIVYVRSRLEFDEATGTHIDKRTGIRYCNKCLVEKRGKAPLKRSKSGSGWWCYACATEYHDPTYVPPSEPPRREPVRRSWIWGDRYWPHRDA